MGLVWVRRLHGGVFEIRVETAGKEVFVPVRGDGKAHTLTSAT
jgi:hypothetical protein